MNTALIVVIAILAVFAFVGVKRGFIMTVYKIGGFIAAILITNILNPIVSALALKSDRIYNAVYDKVQSKINLDSFTPLISNAREIGADLSASITKLIITAGAFVFTFVVVLIALRIIAGALDLVSKLPVLHQINNTFGLLAGLVEGYIIVALLGIFVTFIGTTDLGVKILGMINDSTVLSYMYTHNLVLTIIAKLLG